MTTRRRVAELLNQAMVRASKAQVAPLAQATGRGYVAAYDPATHKAFIREGTPDADPTPGFDVPLWLSLKVGAYVLYHELGSDRTVLAPLDRNASVDQFANPLSTPGQIIIAGPGGTPTVIEPPADVTLNYALQWDSATQRPVWVELP